MARKQLALPIDMITRLRDWLDSYAGGRGGATNARVDHGNGRKRGRPRKNPESEPAQVLSATS
jgi:hypothetical protein